MCTTLSGLIQGPVVQSIVRLTSSLRVVSLTVVADSIYNILIFFAEKNVSSFGLNIFLFHIFLNTSIHLHRHYMSMLIYKRDSKKAIQLK